ncbi:choice-of-anchor P family protein [Spirillospora sp. NBC_01491]|uniref:choice-of-anchor P family protein n=1 Tax=Spirillospora sp. NBC_01491 TaxID=2976007 RepID=UPI002E2F6FC2|nr:choice-of-anchor P family protein [Spirillospora sp. NBC_01491]
MRSTNVSRRAVKAGLIATAAGLIATGLAAAVPTAAGAAPRPQGSAWGLAASGLLDLAPMPVVSSADKETSKNLLHLGDAKLVKADAVDVKAAPTNARSTVAGLGVAPAKLTADAVDAKCENGKGSTRLARAVLGGRTLQAAPPPNTTIPVDIDGVGRTSLTLNKQERLANGKLAVTGMELKLPVAKGSTVRVSSATCGQAARHAEKPNKPTGPSAPKPAGEAPAPTPVRNDLPVTG